MIASVPTLARAALRTLGVALALLAVTTSPAVAWDIVSASDGVVVNKEPGDTWLTALTLYFDYKGGNEATGTYPLRSASSYNQSLNLTSAYSPSAVAVEAFEVPPVAGYRWQMLYSNDASNTTRYFMFANDAAAVAVENTAGAPVRVQEASPIAVEGPNSDGVPIYATAPLDVDMGGAVKFSVEDTLPVTFTGQGYVTLAAVLAIAAAGAGGVMHVAHRTRKDGRA